MEKCYYIHRCNKYMIIYVHPQTLSDIGYGLWPAQQRKNINDTHNCANLCMGAQPNY